MRAPTLRAAPGTQLAARPRVPSARRVAASPLLLVLLAGASAGCLSDPTPHPGQPDGAGRGAAEDALSSSDGSREPSNGGGAPDDRDERFARDAAGGDAAYAADAEDAEVAGDADAADGRDVAGDEPEAGLLPGAPFDAVGDGGAGILRSDAAPGSGEARPSAQ